MHFSSRFSACSLVPACLLYCCLVTHHTPLLSAPLCLVTHHTPLLSERSRAARWCPASMWRILDGERRGGNQIHSLNGTRRSGLYKEHKMHWTFLCQGYLHQCSNTPLFVIRNFSIYGWEKYIVIEINGINTKFWILFNIWGQTLEFSESKFGLDLERSRA